MTDRDVDGMVPWIIVGMFIGACLCVAAVRFVDYLVEPIAISKPLRTPTSWQTIWENRDSALYVMPAGDTVMFRRYGPERIRTWPATAGSRRWHGVFSDSTGRVYEITEWQGHLDTAKTAYQLDMADTAQVDWKLLPKEDN